MQIGIIGLPYSGKTTLFQTLTGVESDSDTKKEVSQAVIKIPDERLEKLTAIFNPKKQINAVIDIIDIAGVQSPDGEKAQFTSQFITKVRYNDAFLHVVRAFDDNTVPHIYGNVAPMRDIQNIEDEFILTDLAFIETRLEKIEKEMMKQRNKDEIKREKEIIIKWNDSLMNNIPLRDMEITLDDIKYIKNYQPLSAKPMIIALNLNESDVKNTVPIIEEIKTKLLSKAIAIEPFFAKIEKELAQLDSDEKQIFMEEYGLTESPLNRMIRSAYRLLGLSSFFTVGEDECRAWTIKKGMNAQEAAGTIHTDFYNKFIRAEVVHYNDFIEAGSLQKCKEKGLFRLEGKEYIVKDGDILNIRHG
jgi:ribosome-binding ATPase